MATTERLGIADIERAIVTFRDALVAHKPRINALNVYPVPDGDTGTNMSLTLESVVEAMLDADPAGDGDDPAAVWKAISHGSLMGARGNSGVILSQILRGLVEVMAQSDTVDAVSLTGALRAAADAAYGAVMRPVEGTILTVVREVAEEAEAFLDGAGDTAPLGALLEACARRGADALARTPQLLPVLADAGVVDAGGAGLLLLLDALLHVVDGRELPDVGPVAGPVAEGHGGNDHGLDTGETRYEVMFFLETPDEHIDEFKANWDTLGDSIVVVGGDGIWNCHIHTNDIGASIEAGIAVGRPHTIRVTDLFEQVEHLEDIHHDDVPHVTLHNPEPCTTAAVAVGVGLGVRRIFESLGVHAVITGGQTMNPSTAQLLQAVEQVPADQVVLLPNNKNIIPVAEQVDAQTTKTVRVVPTRGIAEGFASLLAYDPGTGADDNVAAMTDAAGAVVAGEVTRAVRASRTDVGEVAEGDWIGLDRSGVRAIAASMAGAATALLDDLVTDDHELVTVIAGADATAPATDEIVAWLGEHRPDVEVEVHDGKQPLYPYYFGIE